MATESTAPQLEQENADCVTQFYKGDSVSEHKDESVGYLLSRAHRILIKNMEDRLHTYNLTGTQWTPLLAISHGRCNTVAGCARETGVDIGAMTRMLDRLEAKGLVNRQRSVEDRRVINIALTKKGEQVSSEIPHIVSNVLNNHLKGFSDLEFNQMKSLLKHFLANGEMFSKQSNQQGEFP